MLIVIPYCHYLLVLLFQNDSLWVHVCLFNIASIKYQQSALNVPPFCTHGPVCTLSFYVHGPALFCSARCPLFYNFKNSTTTVARYYLLLSVISFAPWVSHCYSVVNPSGSYSNLLWKTSRLMTQDYCILFLYVSFPLYCVYNLVQMTNVTFVQYD